MLALARRLGRPVKWTETRSEHMTTSHHGRDQINYVTLGAKSDGTVTGCQARIIADLGAYQLLLTPFIPDARLPGDGRLLPVPGDRHHITGRLHQQDVHGRHPRRRPARGDLLDRADDGPARRRAGHGPARAAAQELHPQGGVPVRDRARDRLRLGRLPRARSTSCSQHFDLDAFRAEQEELRAQGHLPRRRLLHLCRGLRAGALAGGRPAGGGPPGGVLRVGQRARVPHRLGDRLLRAPRRTGRGSTRASPRSRATSSGSTRRTSTSLHGDTDQGAWGWDTYGSRSLAVGGEAIARAARKVQDKAKRICAALLEAAPEDIELADGKFQVQGLARQGDDDGRDLRRGAHPAQRAAGRHRAGARGELLLRPGELRVPVRRARVRRRGGRRDRQGRGGALRAPSTTAGRRSTRC